MNLQSLKFGYERQQKKINRRGIIDTHTIKPLEDQNISFQDSTTHTHYAVNSHSHWPVVIAFASLNQNSSMNREY